MIKYVDSDKSLKVPRNLGNYPQSSVTGGTTPEEVQRMIDASLEDYTLTDDFATINGRPITEGGNIEVSGGTPTQVTVTQVVTGGTKIATIGVDGTETDLYAPASGGGVTPQDVQDAIDQALQDYPTSAVTQDLDERVTELENDSVDYATTADTQALETAISGKSTVVWNQIATGGTKVAEITVDGTKTDVYAPQGGGVTPQDVQDAIDSALTNYYTKSQADSAFTDPAEAEQIATDAVNAFSQNDFQPFASQVGQDIENLQTGKQDKLTPGTGIQISGNTISCTVSGYTLPVATQQVLGGVKVGSGLTIDQNGVLSATGGGASDYIVTGALSAVTNPTEGQMATVEGGDVVKPLIEAYFTDYSSYDGSTFVSLYRTSDDGLVKDIWFDGSEFRDGINNDGNWQDYNWEGQDVRLRVIRDDSDHSSDKVQIVNDGTVYMTPGSFTATGSTSVTEFQPALNYIRTGNKWLQYGKVYDWNDIKDNTSADTVALVAEIRTLAKTGVPVWVRMDGQVTYHGGIQCVLPYVTQGSDWVDFIGTGTQYGIGRYCHLYISDTKFDADGFDSHGYRFDNNDIANLPNTMCVYVGPQGDFWGHRSAEVLYQEELVPYAGVKGCTANFEEEYGFGSIVYARKWIDQSDVTHYKFCLIVPTNTGVYRGIWETTNLGDVSQYTLKFWHQEYSEWSGSQQAYNSLQYYDSDVLYFIDQN